MPDVKALRKTHGMVTAKDVADSAGVSLTTVSRCFGEAANLVSKKTRERVMSVASQLGYSPNIAARLLASRKSNLIGLLVNNFDDPEHLDLFRFVSAEAQKQKYHAILLNISKDRLDSESIDMALQYQVDGLLVAASHLTDEMAKRCAAQNKPIVIVGRKSNRPEYSSVYCNNEDGAAQVAAYFHSKGVSRPAFIGGSPTATVTKERMAGFVRKTEELYGFQPITRMAGTNDFDKGRIVARELLEMPKPPDGFFCSSDLLAVGVKDAIAEFSGGSLGPEPPVVGFGQSMLSRLSAYQLLSVGLPFETMVRAATSHLVDVISGEISEPTEIVFSCKLLDQENSV